MTTTNRWHGKFSTLRHCETVRNYLNLFVREILSRGEHHDQSKLEGLEARLFDEMTHELRGLVYGTEEYNASLKKLEPALKHHYANNRHHTEHHLKGIRGMNIIDIMEMLCDWKASSLRQNEGNILLSLKENQERYRFSDELYEIFENTFEWLDNEEVYHHAEQS